MKLYEVTTIEIFFFFFLMGLETGVFFCQANSDNNFKLQTVEDVINKCNFQYRIFNNNYNTHVSYLCIK